MDARGTNGSESIERRLASLEARLGLVLLAGAWLWQRSQPKPPIHGGLPPA